MPPSLSERKRLRLALAAICLLSIACRLPMLGGSFIRFDDPRVITRNLVVTDLTRENFREVAFTNYMGTASPFMYAVGMLNWAVSPGYAGFAAFNIAWMAATVLLFFAFTGLFVSGARWRLAATALFAVLSVNADTVGWMSARCHFLGVAFVLACFVLWQRYREEPARFPRAAYYGLALVAGAWAIWSKSIFVTIGGLLFLYDWYRRRRPGPAFFLDKLPLLAVAAYAMTQPPNSLVMEGIERPSMGTSFASTLLNDAGLLVEYLRRMIVPGGSASAVSTYPVDGLWQMSGGAGLLAMRLPPAANLALLALLAGGVWILARRSGSRALWFVLLMFFASFAPSMNIPPRWVEFAFRFAFLPSAFFCLAAALALEALWPRIAGAGRRWPRIAVGAALSLWIAGHGAATALHGAARHDTLYWRKCVEHLPDSVVCLMKASEYYVSVKDVDAAIRTIESWENTCTEKVVIRRFDPAFRLGKIHEGRKDRAMACEAFERAIREDRLTAGQKAYAARYVASCRKRGKG